LKFQVGPGSIHFDQSSKEGNCSRDAGGNFSCSYSGSWSWSLRSFVEQQGIDYHFQRGHLYEFILILGDGYFLFVSHGYFDYEFVVIFISCIYFLQFL
jgi:hypothetical protein